MKMERKFRIQNASGAVLWVLLGVTAVVLALFFLGGETPPGERLVADLTKDEPLHTDALLVWMYVLLGVAVAATLGTMAHRFLRRWAASPREALRPLAGAGLLTLVLGMAWLCGSDRPLDMPGYDGGGNTPFWLRLADMFLYTVYVLLGVAVVVVIGFAVRKRVINRYHN